MGTGRTKKIVTELSGGSELVVTITDLSGKFQFEQFWVAVVGENSGNGK